VKNIFIYYFSLFAPLFLLMFLWEQIDSTVALVLLAGYVFIYRTWIDGLRLHHKGLISKNEIWKVSFSGARMKYFKALYLQK
jgi:hypothetical protein